jgi:hypothetical protein
MKDVLLSQRSFEQLSTQKMHETWKIGQYNLKDCLNLTTLGWYCSIVTILA